MIECCCCREIRTIVNEQPQGPLLERGENANAYENLSFPSFQAELDFLPDEIPEDRTQRVPIIYEQGDENGIGKTAYVGTVDESGQRSGEGTMIWNQGTALERYYTGGWVEGKAEGHGALSSGPGGWLFRG